MRRRHCFRGRGAPARAGFTLIELLVVIAIIALLIGILLPALGEARRAARVAIDLSKLKQLSTATNSYAADYQDKLFSFTWRKGYNQSDYAPLNAQAAGSDVQAAAAQAVEILRKRADRTDIEPIPNWIPHVMYSHLVLQDYLGQMLPDRLVVSTGDQNRLLWQTDPRGFDQGLFQPAPTGAAAPGTNAGRRWPYSSSFQVTTSSYDMSRVGARLQQVGNAHNTYTIPNAAQLVLGKNKLADTAYPSQKVHMHDQHARHFGKVQSFFGYPQARVCMSFMDNSCSVRLTADANRGWQPNNPTAMNAATSFIYQPDVWEPPTHNGAVTEPMPYGYYRWTRGFNIGIDFRGVEIYTGP
ncbi:MAG: type II secretion system protein [Phycisphaerales bacterium]